MLGGRLRRRKKGRIVGGRGRRRRRRGRGKGRVCDVF